jgi:anti-anti-sigma factor
MSPKELTVTLEIKDDYTVVALSGAMTFGSHTEFLDMARKALASKVPTLLVEGTYLTFMDSSGLSALVTTLRESKAAEKRLRFVGFAGEPMKVIKTTHMDLILDLFDSIDEATKG